MIHVKQIYSTKEQDSLEEAILSRSNSEFLFTVQDSNGRFSNHEVSVIYIHSTKTYNVVQSNKILDRDFHCETKSELISQLSVEMSKVGFKSVNGRSDEMYKSIVGKSTRFEEDTSSEFDSVQDTNMWGTQLKGTDAIFKEFMGTMDKLDSQDLDSVVSEITSLAKEFTIPKYQSRKLEIEKMYKAIKKEQAATEFIKQIADKKITFPKTGDEEVDAKLDVFFQKHVQAATDPKSYDPERFLLTKDLLENSPIKEALVKNKYLFNQISSQTELDMAVSMLSGELTISDIKNKFHTSMYDLDGTLRSLVLAMNDIREKKTDVYILHYGTATGTPNGKVILSGRDNSRSQFENAKRNDPNNCVVGLVEKHVGRYDDISTFGEKTTDLYITKEGVLQILKEYFSSSILSNILENISNPSKLETLDLQSRVTITIQKHVFKLFITGQDVVNFLSRNVTLNEYYNYIVDELEKVEYDESDDNVMLHVERIY